MTTANLGRTGHTGGHAATQAAAQAAAQAAGHAAGQVAERAAEHVADIRGQVHDALVEAKPRLRGWLHAATAPLALAAGAVLVILSPTSTTRTGSAIFAASAVLLFTASATMHRGRWSPRTNTILTRVDHASIFLLIAGSYTPFTLLLLDGPARTTLLRLAWGGAAAGIAFRLVWTTAPRWVYTPVYIALGWVAVLFADDFLRHGPLTVVALLAAGGLLYTVGGVVYGLRRPNPFPGWLGFHEVFHLLTVAAFATHYLAISLATYALR
jgi:hemolysin III